MEEEVFEDDVMEEDEVLGDDEDHEDYVEEDFEKVFEAVIAKDKTVYFLESDGSWFKKTLKDEGVALQVAKGFN